MPVIVPNLAGTKDFQIVMFRLNQAEFVSRDLRNRCANAGESAAVVLRRVPSQTNAPKPPSISVQVVGSGTDAVVTLTSSITAPTPPFANFDVKDKSDVLPAATTSNARSS